MLLTNHLIRTLINNLSNLNIKPIPYSIKMLTNCQKTIAKGHLINSNNKLFRIFSSFSPLHLEFNLGSRIVDKFSDWFSFNLSNREKNNKIHFQQLDEISLQSSSLPHTAIVISDASIKNNIAISISHIHICDHLLIKMVHHATFITSTKAELFAIRCGINQAYSIENISKIIVIIDSIHAVKKIFESKSHLYQLHTTAILSELHRFFATNQENYQILGMPQLSQVETSPECWQGFKNIQSTTYTLKQNLLGLLQKNWQW